MRESKQLTAADRQAVALAIREGVPFASIAHVFATKHQALSFYGHCRSGIFRAADVEPACMVCGSAAAEPVEFDWIGHYWKMSAVGLVAVFAGHFGPIAHRDSVRASTFHPLCDSCRLAIDARPPFKQSLVWPACRAISLIVFIVALIALIMPTIADEMPAKAKVTTAGSALSVMLFAWLLDQHARRSLKRIHPPENAQAIVGPPFKLHRLLTMERRATDVQHDEFVQRFRRGSAVSISMAGAILIAIFVLPPAVTFFVLAFIDTHNELSVPICSAVLVGVIGLMLALLMLDRFTFQRAAAVWYFEKAQRVEANRFAQSVAAGKVL